MFNKFLGAIAIMGCSVFISKSMTDKLKKRKASLNSFHKILVMLESEISFSVNSINQALKNISDSVNLPDFFNYILPKTEHLGIRKVWSESIEHCKDKLCLSNEDVKILNTLSAQLGITDKDNQIKNIHYVLTMLEHSEQDAENRLLTMSKLYRAFGISAGLTTVILLI